jgi:hypothetical protein
MPSSRLNRTPENQDMTKRISLATALMLMAGTTMAADDAGGSYDISDADRQLMMDSTNHYNICLHEKADLMFDQYDDVRRVADEAMKACEPILTELDANLAKAKLADDFRLGYIRHTKNSGGRKLLPELMARKAQ